MAPDTEPGTSPIVFETLAVTGAYPNPRSTGNVISVPLPTTVLIVPAATPAPKMASACRGVTRTTLPSVCGRPGRSARRPAVVHRHGYPRERAAGRPGQKGDDRSDLL